MTERPSTLAPQKGLSLVELMVAMLVGLILTAGAIQIFISSRQTYRVQENLSRMQENARFAMEYLRRDIRMADYWGCIPDPQVASTGGNIQNILKSPNDVSLNINAGVSGTNGQGTAPDSITLSGAKDLGVRLVKDSSSGKSINETTKNMKVNSTNGIKEGDILYLSTCSHGAIFQATNVQDESGTGLGKNKDQNVINYTSSNSSNLTPGNKNEDFDPGFSDKTPLLKVNSFTYSIDNTKSPPALVRTELNGSPIEIVRGVENMQITYGEDTNDDGVPNYFVPAGTTDFDIDSAVAIRISLLMRSDDDNVTSRPIDYSYNGAPVTPTDRYLRQVFTFTVAVRNRLD